MIQHIYPLNDFKEHETDGELCWCHPEIDYDYEEGFTTLIHNSLDGRELIETGERMIQ